MECPDSLREPVRNHQRAVQSLAKGKMGSVTARMKIRSIHLLQKVTDGLKISGRDFLRKTLAGAFETRQQHLLQDRTNPQPGTRFHLVEMRGQITKILFHCASVSLRKEPDRSALVYKLESEVSTYHTADSRSKGKGSVPEEPTSP